MNEIVYDILISLNRFFVFKLWIRFNLVPRLRILRKDWCFWDFGDTGQPQSGTTTAVWCPWALSGALVSRAVQCDPPLCRVCCLLCTVLGCAVLLCAAVSCAAPFHVVSCCVVLCCSRGGLLFCLGPSRCAVFCCV